MPGGKSMDIRIFATALCVSLVFNINTASASVVFYNDLTTFNSNTSTSVVDFEGIVGANESIVGSAHIIDDIAFTTNTASTTVKDAVICGYNKCSGRPHDSALFLASNTSGVPADIVIDLSALTSPVTAVGGIFGDINGDDAGTNGTVTLKLYSEAGMIDSQDVSYGDMRSGQPKTFFGWSTTNGVNITKVELVTGDIEFSALDDFHYGAAVPIPAAVWLFGSGLLGLAAVARRRR
jgi:hypothetical protein